ncbi:MAG: hypothetical protein ABW003_14840 [Microvirga sp.]
MPTPAVTWIRIGERHPDLAQERDYFLALDGEVQVGIVRLINFGPETGRWLWSMLLTHPGPAFTRPTSGTAPTRWEAVRDLVDCYRAFREWSGLDED